MDDRVVKLSKFRVSQISGRRIRLSNNKQDMNYANQNNYKPEAWPSNLSNNSSLQCPYLAPNSTGGKCANCPATGYNQPYNASNPILNKNPEFPNKATNQNAGVATNITQPLGQSLKNQARNQPTNKNPHQQVTPIIISVEPRNDESVKCDCRNCQFFSGWCCMPCALLIVIFCIILWISYKYKTDADATHHSPANNTTSTTIAVPVAYETLDG